MTLKPHHLLAMMLAFCLLLPAIVNATPWQGTEKGGQDASNAQSKDDIKLPEGQESPILVFDQAGGFRRGPKLDPNFQLFADGRVVALNSSTPFEFKLKKADVQKLLQFVVADHNAYDLDSDKLLDAMKAQGKPPNQIIADATSATLKLELPRGKHEVSVYALFLAEKNFPKIEGLGHLAAIERRCNQIVALQILGDKKNPVMKFINDEIKRQGLKIDPVKIEELRRCSKREGGQVQATFERKQPNAENDRSPIISISYFVDQKTNQPKVRVYGLQRE